MDEKNIKSLLGKKVKYLRNTLNLTQFTLGEMADINQRQIALIEAGKSFPSLKTLVKLCDIFSCKLYDLFNFDNFQDTNILKEEIEKMLETSTKEYIQTLYTIAKGLK